MVHVFFLFDQIFEEIDLLFVELNRLFLEIGLVPFRKGLKEVVVKHFAKPLQQAGINGFSAVNIKDIGFGNIECRGELFNGQATQLYNAFYFLPDDCFSHEPKLGAKSMKQIIHTEYKI